MRSSSWLAVGAIAVALVIAAPIDRGMAQDLSFDLVIAIGDSIIAGHPYHDPDPEYYGDCDNGTSCMEYRLGQLMGQEVVNKGCGGDTTSDILSRFETDVLQYGPDLVIVEGGINDIARDVGNCSLITDNLALMYESVIENEGMVIAYTILPDIYLNDSQEGLRVDVNDWVMEQSNDDILTVDVAHRLADSLNPRALLPQYDSGDHVHPSCAGYWEMANFTYEAITYAIDEGDGKAINDETALGIVGSVAVLLAVAIGASVYVAVMSLKRVSTRE